MRKRRKKKIKKSAIIFLLIIVLLIVSIVFLNRKNPEKSSKTLETIKNSDLYNEKYKNEYLEIEYIEENDFLKNINEYLGKGYNSKEINNIYKLSKLNREKLLELDKQDFEKFINIKNFDVNKIDRYNEFASKNDYKLEDIVTYVNVNIDIPFYSETSETKDPDSLLVLVNKYNHLPDNYKPSDLVYVPGAYGNNVPFRSVLKESFEALQKAAKEEINIDLMPTTAFRNQSFQTTLYNNYVASDGKEKADTYSARPGYSEHQTGLAIDLKNMALSNVRLTDDNYNWLENNAYKYGFIIRFPKDKEFVTGYQFENWHIRYVGNDIAKIIYDNKLTLEEYIDLYETQY